MSIDWGSIIANVAIPGGFSLLSRLGGGNNKMAADILFGQIAYEASVMQQVFKNLPQESPEDKAYAFVIEMQLFKIMESAKQGQQLFNEVEKLQGT